MATIGTFTKTANGDITGTVKTLTLNVKAKFVPTEGDSERGPDYRIFAGTTEFGAAWKKTARETGRDYLSVKLDDPSFPAPIYASLVEDEGGEAHNLIWSRRNGDRGPIPPRPRTKAGPRYVAVASNALGSSLGR